MFRVKLEDLMDSMDALSPCVTGDSTARDIRITISGDSAVFVGRRGAPTSAGWVLCKATAPVVNEGGKNLDMVVNYDSLWNALTIHLGSSDSVALGLSDDGMLLIVGATASERVFPSVLRWCEKVSVLGFSVPATYAEPLFSVSNKAFYADLNKVLYVCAHAIDDVTAPFKFMQVGVSDKGAVCYTCINTKRFAEAVSSDELVCNDFLEKNAGYLMLFGDTLHRILSVVEGRQGELSLTDNKENAILSTVIGNISVEYYMFCVHGSIPRPIELFGLARKVLLTCKRSDIASAVAEIYNMGVSEDDTAEMETTEKNLSLTVSCGGTSVVDIPCLSAGVSKWNVMKLSVKLGYLRDAMLNLFDEEYITFGFTDKSTAVTIFTDSYYQGMMPENFKTWYKTTYANTKVYSEYGDLYYGESCGNGKFNTEKYPTIAQIEKETAMSADISTALTLPTNNGNPF